MGYETIVSYALLRFHLKFFLLSGFWNFSIWWEWLLARGHSVYGLKMQESLFLDVLPLLKLLHRELMQLRIDFTHFNLSFSF